MTNGEKIKEIFPSMIIGFITESQIGIYCVKNQHSATVFSLDWWNAEYKEPTTKNDLGVDCIDRAELLKAVDTWDKFGCDADTKLVPYQDHYIPYIYYDDVIKCIKGMPSVTPQPCEDAISRKAVLDLINADWKYEGLEIEINNLPSVTPQEPRKGYLSIDDVMAVFDDFMCGEVDEDGTETFMEMLKDKADMRGEE